MNKPTEIELNPGDAEILHGILDGGCPDILAAAGWLGVEPEDLATEVVRYVLSPDYANDFAQVLGILNLEPRQILDAATEMERTRGSTFLVEQLTEKVGESLREEDEQASLSETRPGFGESAFDLPFRRTSTMEVKAESQTGTTLRVLLRDPGDPHAWQAFVDRYTPKVLAWCRQWYLQPADAQDVTQEVMHRLARHLHHFPYDPAKGHFRGWLKTVTRHAWSDFRDARRRAGWGSGDPHIHQLLDNQESRNDLAEALTDEFTMEVYEEAAAQVQLRVSRTTWQAFELLAREKWSGKQVATHLHMTVAAVYMAKKRVQTMLAEETRKLEGSSGTNAP